MHHTDIDIGWTARIRFLEYPDEIMPYLPEFEKIPEFTV